MMQGSKVFSGPFIVCVLILASAAVGKEMLVRWAGVAMRKEPVPLRKHLASLDKTRLGDYRVLESGQMTSAMEAAVGTTEYLDWVLEDTSLKLDANTRQADPRRKVRLLVTYYTGSQDPVPHTAEVCYLGAGYEQKQAHESRTIEVPALGTSGTKVPIRVCTFIKTAIFNREEPTVVYTFHANGHFAADRDSVRLTIANPLNKRAYFSKVEVSFFGGGTRIQARNLGREQSVAAATKLFNTVLPILVQDHWPDWENVERSKTPSASAPGA